MVCSVQVHSHRTPHEEAEEEDNPQVLESSSHQETGSIEESSASEGEAQRAVSGAEEGGETFTPLIGCGFVTFKTDLNVLTF